MIEKSLLVHKLTAHFHKPMWKKKGGFHHKKKEKPTLTCLHMFDKETCTWNLG